MSNGAILVEIPEFDLPAGWNIARGTVIFMLPPGYPSAQPDCFWLEPGPVRLADGSVPNAANDANPVPGAGPRGTWFSWHLQSWNPNRDDILTYFNVIAQRLSPAR
ncbi:E2/UBC family protein [Bradyrhizobium sp. 62B]|uniref:E2/UBC family protein n=1 Tax=Bradyrhizobium sp. 62B TaxID=2898442 RepID=UPI0035DD4211